MAYEGQTATGPNGERAVFTGGRWVVTGGNASPQPTVTPLPESPQQARESARKDRDEGRDEIRTGIAQRGEGRDEQKQGFQLEGDLRKEFNSLPEVRDYQTVIRQYATALKTPSNASGDQALITAYAKMLDPSSVVRESEFSTVANADSALGTIKSQLSRQFGIDGGGMLRPEIRQRIRNNMQNLTEEYNNAYNQARSRYGQVAQDNGIKVDNVIGPHLGQPYYETIDRIRNPERQPRQETAPQRGETIQYSQEVPGGLEGSVTDDSPTPPPGSYQDSYVGQGMSGVNEGIANLLGAPVDLTTAAMNLVPQGLNAVANTGIPTIDRPFLGGQYIRDLMRDWAIAPQTDDPSKQFTRRVGESIGASVLPVTGTAATSLPRAAAMLTSAAGGGAGAATAQQVFPGNPVAEFIGELMGAGATGAGIYGAARRNARREIEKKVPTIGDLKTQAGDLYRRAEANGVTADPRLTRQLADDFRQALVDEGRIDPTGHISEVYPKAREATRLVDAYAGQQMNPKQIQTVRKVIADGLNSAEAEERRLASILTDTFDNWSDPLAPELKQARQVASRYLNAQKLEQARELAGARAGQFSGSGFENALRTEYRALDRNAIKGKGRYGEDVRMAIERVNRGTPVSNTMRNLGRFAPRGVFSSLGPTAVGGAIGGPVGATIGGVGAATIGELGRQTATRMGIRNAELAELIARNGGALPEPNMNMPEVEKMAAQLALALQAGYINPYED